MYIQLVFNPKHFLCLCHSDGAHVPMFTSRKVSRGGRGNRTDQPTRALLVNGLRGLPPRHHSHTGQTSAARPHGRLRSPRQDRTSQTRLHLLLPAQRGRTHNPRQQNGHRRWRGHRSATAADRQMAAAARGGRQRALTVRVLSKHVQSGRKRTRALSGSSGPRADVHSSGELHVVRGQPALPLHVGPRGRLFGPLFLRRQRRAILPALASTPGTVAASALHVLLRAVASVLPLWRGVPLLRRQAQSRGVNARAHQQLGKTTA